MGRCLVIAAVSAAAACAYHGRDASPDEDPSEGIGQSPNATLRLEHSLRGDEVTGRPTPKLGGVRFHDLHVAVAGPPATDRSKLPEIV